MENGIGEILYIVAMLAIFVFSAYKKSQQAKKKVTPPNQTPHVPDPMDEEDIMKELKDLFQPQQPGKATVPVEKKPVQPVVPTDTNKYAKPQAKISERKISREIKVELEEEGEGNHILDEDFDLRKAVIYSEILKRPGY
ncbi:hypothetical protein DMA11_04530 [Marinilabiliaceae bacterium JC017]|nr:hypothetical protein DMA11_04530 [Marinilabiliaceae bacterium JC017]